MTNNFGEHFSKTEVVILPSELLKRLRTTESVSDCFQKRGQHK
jgi:hypothetical protein